MKNKILLFLLVSPFLFYHEALSQIHMYSITPIDTISHQDSVIKNFKFVDYNEDDNLDYYIATDKRSYLHDGFSGDIIWQSPEISSPSFENL